MAVLRSLPERGEGAPGTAPTSGALRDRGDGSAGSVPALQPHPRATDVLVAESQHARCVHEVHANYKPRRESLGML